MIEKMKIERFQNTPLRPDDRRLTAIEVPQGFCGVACGIKNDIRFITTSVAQCVALALIRKHKDKPPFVMLAHIDDFFEATTSAREILQRFERLFKTKVEPAVAYLLNGDSNPELYQPILDVLWSRDMEVYANIELNQCFPLSVDLQTGDLSFTDFRQSGFKLYRPNQIFDAQLGRYVMGNRPFDEVGFVPRIFDLREGLPAGYELKGSAASRQASINPRP